VAAAPASTPLTLLLGVLIALTALGMDMFLPSVPVIAREFGGDAATQRAAQLCVTSYLLGLAIGQLAWGPVSDRHGRKPVLLAGLALFFISTAFAATAQSAQVLVALRFAQGLGMSSGPVISRSIVRDLYAREQAAHLLARMMAVFGVIPVVAPLLGGQALALGSWPAVFATFAVIALLLLVAVGVGIRETAPAQRPSIAPGRIASNFAALFRNAGFRAALLTMACAQMGIIAFVSASALAMVQSFGLTPTLFSLLFSAVMMGQIAGGLLGSRLVPRLGSARLVRLGAALVAAGGALAAALSLAAVPHWSAVVLPMIVYLFGAAFMIPNTTAAALAPFPQMAGSASSLLGAIPFGLGALLSALLAAAFDGSTRPMAVAIALFGAGALLSERFFFRRTAHG
jgi:DHA1 family bicyclomycin/chloramphenicol resistance-like MFS transporter